MILSSTAISANGQEMAITHCNGVCPKFESNLAASRASIVVHNLYAAGLNVDTGLADWVAYRITKEAVGVASLLPREWQPDRLLRFSIDEQQRELRASEVQLPNISSSVSPYTGTNAPLIEKQERARLAPMTSFANSTYWSDLNNLSNMVPMPASLRLGPWLRLEQRLNDLVAKKDELYVISGPLFLITQPLNTTAINVGFQPAAYYKIVVSDSGLATFMFSKDLKQQDRFCSHLGDFRQIEVMSSLEFFPGREFRQSPQLLEDLGCSIR